MAEEISKDVEKGFEILKALKEKFSRSDFILKGYSPYDLPVAVAIANYSKARGIEIKNLDVDDFAKKVASYLELRPSPTIDTPPIGLKSSLVPEIDYERLAREISPYIKQISGSPMTPYIKLRASWEYPEPSEYFESEDSEKLGESEETEEEKGGVDVINEVLQKVPSNGWEPLGYYLVEGEKRDYKGKIDLSEKEKDAVDKKNALNVNVFFNNRINPNLSLEVATDLNSSELDLHLTSFHPDFVQGINNLEDHFEEKDKKEFAKLLNYLEKSCYEKGEEKTEEDVEVEEYADLYEKQTP